MSALEKQWPDPDRRDAALGAVAWAVDHADELWPRYSPAAREQLTPAQIRTVQAMSVGLAIPAAAEVLGISPETVKTHLKHASRALRAKNTTHAVAEALRRGLIQ